MIPKSRRMPFLPNFTQFSNQPADVAYRRWLLFAFLLITVWALALTVSQQFSIPATENYRMKDPVGRFFLSFFLLSPIVLLLPRLMVLGTLVASLLFQWGTMYYCSYFGNAPEIMMLWNNGSEGIVVGNAIWAMLPWHSLLFLIPVLAIQVVLLYSRVPPKSFYPRRWAWSLISIAAYGTMILLLNDDSGGRKGGRGLHLNAKAIHSNGDRCAKFGFLPVFTRDLFFRYLYVDTLKTQALENESQRSFGLQSEYREFAFGNVVVMQVETLDNAVLDYCVEGQEVVPFLNSLQKNSLVYRIQASHRYGSATADFEMLNGIPPVEGFFNYQIPALSYNTSLPRFFAEHDYETFCFHGVSGSFYNRRTAFTAMKFDHLFFREDIVEAILSGKHPLHEEFSEAKLKQCLNENWLRDEVLLKAALQEIRSPSERNRFFFVITETSHAPYLTEHFDSSDKLIPNETSLQDKYLNLIHLVDDWLRSFYEGLPKGTLLVIYGDHTSGFRSGPFVADIEGQTEFVPCFIHVVGENLNAFQKIPRRSHEATLSVRDVHSFLRDVTENQSRHADTPTELATPVNSPPLR